MWNSLVDNPPHIVELLVVAAVWQLTIKIAHLTIGIFLVELKLITVTPLMVEPDAWFFIVSARKIFLSPVR